MSAGFADFHDALRAVARAQLGGSDAGAGAEVDWPVAASSGWLGLEVPEHLGGSGATFAEVAVILSEMGRAASAGPYLGAVVLGAGALGLLEPGPGRDELLDGVAAGDVVPALVLAGDAETVVPDALSFRVEHSSDGLRVDGRAAFVPDAGHAGRLLLPAVDAHGLPVVVEVDPAAAGLSIEAQPVLDTTRSFAVVTADGVEVDEASVWRFAADPEASLRRLCDRATVAVASDCVGLSETMLDATVAYAKDRHQFGRPIGSFQAVKHACADMAAQIAVARELVADAVRRVATPEVDTDAGVAASMAKSYAGDAAVAVAGAAMQMHGGIGYTWESGIHIYLKRAVLNRSLFGSPTVHRRRLAARYA